MKLETLKNSHSYSLQLTLGGNPDEGSYQAIWKLDESFINTPNYMGFAYFWDHDVKHTMREMTPKFRKVVHDTAMREKLIKDGFVKTNNKFLQIINLTLKRFNKDISPQTGWTYYFKVENE